MLIEVKESVRRYHVGFEIDNSVRFKKGPNAGRPRIVTTCKIYLVSNVRGKKPVFIASDSAVLGSKDKPDVIVGLKLALTRALDAAKLGKYVNGLIWSNFQTTHRRIDTINIGKPEQHLRDQVEQYMKDRAVEFYRGSPVHGYGGLHSHQKRAMKKLRALSEPTGQGVKAIKYPWQIRGGSEHFRKMYMHSRHEYHCLPPKKLHGLGWYRILEAHTGEQIWPKTKAVKTQELRDMYSSKDKDKITIVNVCQPAKALEAAMGGGGAKIVRDILKEAKRYQREQQWMQGTWAVADDQLTAKMLGMHLTAAKEALKLDVELLSRPGITKVHDEYIIDPDVFVSEFCVGDVVTSDKFGAGRVKEIHGVMLKIQPTLRIGRGYFLSDTTPIRTVADWEVKKRVGRLRVWAWIRGTASRISRGEGYVTLRTRSLGEEPPHGDYGRKLYDMIYDNHCDSCQKHLPKISKSIFLAGPRGGAAKNVKCFYCDQRYWIDPLSCTAKKLND